jgi:hypothetical protein
MPGDQVGLTVAIPIQYRQRAAECSPLPKLPGKRF